MNRPLKHLLTAAAAAAVLFTTGAHAADGALTREQVRAELAEARAAGMIDVWGEAGATESVLRARELHNRTEALALVARYELEAQQVADAQAGISEAPDLASYVEAGPDGPLLMIVTFDGDGIVRSTETVSLAAID